MVNQNSKHCDFTFALHNEAQAFRIIEELPDFDTWAYIKHFPDSDNGTEHYHFYIHIKQPITLKAISNKLDLPIHMIEWVRNKTKLIQYLKHDNQPDKIQYNDDEIITNNREYINNFLYPESNYVDVWKEFKLLDDLANGIISYKEYIDKNSNKISNLPFYSRSIYLMRLINLRKGEDYVGRRL